MGKEKQPVKKKNGASAVLLVAAVVVCLSIPLIAQFMEGRLMKHSSNRSTNVYSVSRMDILGRQAPDARLEIRYEDQTIAPGTLDGIGTSQMKWIARKGKEPVIGLEPGVYIMHEEFFSNGVTEVMEVKFQLTEEGVVKNIANMSGSTSMVEK